ncbi:restriction endonuclease subunit S [Deinococcus arcticus]|uniref:Type I restriction endonuclease subunit S n=1 Tax=Deinococcus arcticus TaxID=2136176 RepID=A0A2T3WB89_9DEIO|nr:restriction endonuclease subunit S [Deinococcus arcticus]PTA69003.1 type I restriction endonuclease subunit S [Deinococcus arcticus]
MSVDKHEDLPSGWATATIPDLTHSQGFFSDGDWVESKDQNPQGNIRLLQLADVGDGFFVDKSQRFIDEDAFKRLRCKEVKSGDVLLARMPEPLGRACTVPELSQKSITVVDVSIIRPSRQAAYSRWLMHTLNAAPIRNEIQALSSGTTRKRISRGNLATIELPLPPLPEQIRIAEKLDAVLARVKSGRERLERVPKLVKQFRQAVLSAAVSGELTREWREQNPQQRAEIASSDAVARGRLWGSGIVPELTPEERESIPSEWDWVKLGALGPDGVPAVQIGPMSMKSNEFSSTGQPVLNVGTVQTGYFDHSKLNFLPHELTGSFKRYVIRTGDILFTRSGTIGRCAVATEKEDGFLMTFHLLRARVSQNVCLTKYAFYALQGGSTVLRQVAESAIGATRAGFNTSLLEGLDIPLPPLPEQLEIVRRVEALFAIADRLEARYQGALTSFERLTPALLAKAFRGELVPQDPNDEPASVLLERIRALRASEGTKSGRGRKAAPKPTGQESLSSAHPPKAHIEDTNGPSEPKRRGRPPKAQAIPSVMNEEEAIRLLEQRRQARSTGTRQVSLFEPELQED